MGLFVNVEHYSFMPTGNAHRDPYTGIERESRIFLFVQDRLCAYDTAPDILRYAIAL